MPTFRPCATTAFLKPWSTRALPYGVGVGGDLVQQRDPDGVLVRRRGRHDHRDHQPQNVNSQAALATRYFFAASHPVDTVSTPAAA